MVPTHHRESSSVEDNDPRDLLLWDLEVPLDLKEFQTQPWDVDTPMEGTLLMNELKEDDLLQAFCCEVKDVEAHCMHDVVRKAFLRASYIEGSRYGMRNP